MCEYSAVTEESMRREREMNARRRRIEPGHPAYSLAPAPSAYAYTSPISPPLPSNGFAGPPPAWTSLPTSPVAYPHRHTIDLASPMQPPHSPAIAQGPFASPSLGYPTAYQAGYAPSPKSSISGYNGGGWQRTHPPATPSFQFAPVTAPLRETHGSTGAHDGGVFGIAPTSVFSAIHTPRMTPSPGKSTPKRPKLKTAVSHMQPLVSPPCSPDVFAFGQSFSGSAYQPSPASTPLMHGLNIMMPVDSEMRSMFSGVEGMESAMGDRMPPPPPYVMGC